MARSFPEFVNGMELHTMPWIVVSTGIVHHRSILLVLPVVEYSPSPFGMANSTRGDIYSINGEPAYNIARWDGSSWHNLAGGLNSQVWRLHGYPDGLYAVGLFTEANGIQVNGLARWNGTERHSVFDLPQFGSSINRVYDVAWYNGEHYICGNFIGDDVLRIARYDGTMWRSVGNGIQGPFSLVNLLEVRDGLL